MPTVKQIVCNLLYQRFPIYYIKVQYILSNFTFYISIIPSIYLFYLSVLPVFDEIAGRSNFSKPSQAKGWETLF